MLENPGQNNNGASVQFQLRSNWGDDVEQHLTAYVWPGPIYRWTHFYGEVLISPGDVRRNFSLKYAPLFGVGKATIGLNSGQLKGYITVEDIGSST